MRSLLLACALGAAARAGDGPADRAFVEVDTPRRELFVRQPVPLRLRFGIDRAHFADHAVPLFPRRMDVPVTIDAPWLEELPGAVPLGAEAPEGGARFALNGEVGRAVRGEDEVRGGRTYAVFHVERRFLPLEAGPLVVPAPTLRWVHATRFAEDFVHGRVAVDPTDVVVAGAPLSLRIRLLPEEGRPPGFEGAVGRFAARAEADRSRVAVGEIFTLVLHVEGEGNLEVVPPPRLEDLPGFHVYGAIPRRAPGRLAVTYDLAPRDPGVTEIPALSFPYFDPAADPPAYRVARTRPVPLEVTAPPAPADAPPEEDARFPLVWGVALAVALAALAAALHRRRRARTAAAADPAAERLAAAKAALRAATTPGERADAFAELLAAHLRCPRAAVISPDLAARLEEAGVDPARAARAAAALEALVAARYGGTPPPAEDLERFQD